MKIKPSILFVLLFCTAGFITSAQAKFIGHYAVGNWTQTISGGNGSMNLAGAPNTVSMTSSNDLNGGNVDFTIAAAASGLVSFNWNYATNDVSSAFDSFGYILGGSYFDLSSPTVRTSQSGTGQFSVASGDIFGFRMNSSDGCCGSATANISSFSGPAGAVPEPETYAMMGIGSLALAWARRRQQKKKDSPELQPASFAAA